LDVPILFRGVSGRADYDFRDGGFEGLGMSVEFSSSSGCVPCLSKSPPGALRVIEDGNFFFEERFLRSGYTNFAVPIYGRSVLEKAWPVWFAWNERRKELEGEISSVPAALNL
jgi:hypothetical protein